MNWAGAAALGLAAVVPWYTRGCELLHQMQAQVYMCDASKTVPADCEVFWANDYLSFCILTSPLLTNGTANASLGERNLTTAMPSTTTFSAATTLAPFATTALPSAETTLAPSATTALPSATTTLYRHRRQRQLHRHRRRQLHRHRRRRQVCRRPDGWAAADDNGCTTKDDPAVKSPRANQ